MADIHVADFEGWQIFVNSYNGSFEAVKGEGDLEKKLTDSTFAALQEQIKRQNSDDRHFKAIDAIRICDTRLGKIVSWVEADRHNRVYFTFPDPDSRNNRKARADHNLEDTWRGTKENDRYTFVKATPANLVIVAQIEALEKEKDAIVEKIIAAKKTFTDPVTIASVEGGS